MEVAWGVAIGETRAPMAEDQDRRAAELKLVRAAQGGDLLAFERLYRDNERKVFGLCFRLSSDPALAEELTQEVFVRAWRKLASFRGESAFSSWLYPLTVNVALSERRSRRRRETRIVAAEDPVRLDLRRLRLAEAAVHEVVETFVELVARHDASASLSSLRARNSWAFDVPGASFKSAAISS